MPSLKHLLPISPPGLLLQEAFASYLSIQRGYGTKLALSKPESRFSSDSGSAGALILGFPAFRTVKNNVYCLTQPIYGIFVILD